MWRCAKSLQHRFGLTSLPVCLSIYLPSTGSSTLTLITSRTTVSARTAVRCADVGDKRPEELREPVEIPKTGSIENFRQFFSVPTETRISAFTVSF
jgi:hypothetical protein